MHEYVLCFEFEDEADAPDSVQSGDTAGSIHVMCVELLGALQPRRTQEGFCTPSFDGLQAEP